MNRIEKDTRQTVGKIRLSAIAILTLVATALPESSITAIMVFLQNIQLPVVFQVGLPSIVIGMGFYWVLSSTALFLSPIKVMKYQPAGK